MKQKCENQSLKLSGVSMFFFVELRFESIFINANKNQKMQLKQLLFLVFILSLITLTFCQAQITTFQFDKMNVAYKGLPNQITIKTESDKNLKTIPKVSTVYGSFEFVDSTSNGNITEFKFSGEFIKTGKHTILIESEIDTLLTNEIRCKNIPDPEFLIDLKHRAGEISKKEIRKAIGVGAVLRNFDFYYQFRSKSFRCTIIKNKRLESNFECEGFRFSEELKAVLKSLNSDDIIIFDQILVVGDNREERIIPSVSYRIK